MSKDAREDKRVGPSRHKPQAVKAAGIEGNDDDAHLKPDYIPGYDEPRLVERQGRSLEEAREVFNKIQRGVAEKIAKDEEEQRVRHEKRKKGKPLVVGNATYPESDRLSIDGERLYEVKWMGDAEQVKQAKIKINEKKVADDMRAANNREADKAHAKHRDMLLKEAVEEYAKGDTTEKLEAVREALKSVRAMQGEADEDHKKNMREVLEPPSMRAKAHARLHIADFAPGAALTEAVLYRQGEAARQHQDGMAAQKWRAEHEKQAIEKMKGEDLKSVQENLDKREEKIPSAEEQWDIVMARKRKEELGEGADGGGMRYNKGKIRMDLTPPEWEYALADVSTQGSKKYADRNWELGMKWSTMVGCMKRHLNKYLAGQRYDGDKFDLDAGTTGCHELAMVAWNALALMSYDLRGVGENDLAKVKGAMDVLKRVNAETSDKGVKCDDG